MVSVLGRKEWVFFARLWLKKIELDPGGDFSDQGNGGMDVEQKSADWERIPASGMSKREAASPKAEADVGPRKTCKVGFRSKEFSRRWGSTIFRLRRARRGTESPPRAPPSQ